MENFKTTITFHTENFIEKYHNYTLFLHFYYLWYTFSPHSRLSFSLFLYFRD